MAVTVGILCCSSEHWFEGSEMVANTLVIVLNVLVTIYTYVTLPVYYLLQRPWRALYHHRKLRVQQMRHAEIGVCLMKRFTQAVPVMQDKESIVYRSVLKISDVHVRFLQDKVDTMEKVFRFAVKHHGQKSALGTREILAEEDEVQPCGRVFKKVCDNF